MSGKGRLTWFPLREEGAGSWIAEAACAGTREKRSFFPTSGAGESAGSTSLSLPTRTRTITAGGRRGSRRRPGGGGGVERGPSAWGEDPGEEEGGNRVVFLPHHGSPGAQPGAWIRAASPDAVVSQNSDCFRKGNLVPSLQSFFLENGAVTMRSDGVSVFIEQER